jgi:hypothetical protein
MNAMMIPNSTPFVQKEKKKKKKRTIIHQILRPRHSWVPSSLSPSLPGDLLNLALLMGD